VRRFVCSLAWHRTGWNFRKGQPPVSHHIPWRYLCRCSQASPIGRNSISGLTTVALVSLIAFLAARGSYVLFWKPQPTLPGQ